MTKITRSSSKNIALYKNVGCFILASKVPQIYNEIHPLVAILKILLSYTLNNEQILNFLMVVKFFKKQKFSNEKAV